MNAFLLAVLLGQNPSHYTPQEAQALFAEGSDAYYKQDFVTAKDKFERLVKADLGGPDVLFNLGTTHLAAGELGPAVLYLERAHRMSREDDIEANLAVARERQGDQVIGAEASEPFAQRVAGALDVQVVSIAFLVLWNLAFIAWFFARRATSGRLVKTLGASALSLVAIALGIAVGIHAYVARTVVEGVVMPASTQVREFPGERARVAFEVHAGLKVRIMEESGKYVRIRLPNALEGWTEKEGLVEL